jgi:uncharacterized membrane protein YhiD involved in acid resistance
VNELFGTFSPEAPGALFHPLDVVLVAALTALMTFIITKTYQATHRGPSYSQGYIHGLFLMAFCTAIVMMIIGSNIARAFSLVGALSIIRFRTAVKDVRDTAYLFFAIVVGMGCGTGFYLHTLVFTVVTVLFMWGLHRFDYALKSETEQILKITFRRGSEAVEAVEELLGRTLREHRLINSLRNFDSEDDTHVYVVRNVRDSDREALLRDLEAVEDVTKVALYINDQQVNL